RAVAGGGAEMCLGTVKLGPNNQKILIDSFKALSDQDGCQVILTTHSPGFAAELPVDSIRYVTRDAAGKPEIRSGVDVFDQVSVVTRFDVPMIT
ncbi:MAG TPA: hypothetical protein PLE66_14140, partial [Thauera aminoaromatica]|nr:hypothetical protein [Thauera aminoaromatica]